MLSHLIPPRRRVFDPGAVVLFKALRRSQLRSLNLRANQLTDGCTRALQEALAANPQLEQVPTRVRLLRHLRSLTLTLSLSLPLPS